MKEIVQDGAEVLREIAKPVPEKLFGSAELAKLIRDMEEALDEKEEEEGDEATSNEDDGR